MIATLQQQSCKLSSISICANWDDMNGLESDTAFVKDLCQWAKLAPSPLAKAAALTPTTLLRPFNATATTRLSQPTLDKLRAKFPDYPGWQREHPDQIGHHNPDRETDPNERADELVYIREVDISLAMGDGVVVEDFPATQLVPFNLSFIRGVTRANTEKLVIFTGQGDSMEPTLLRSDFLMIDTGTRGPVVSDTIWAFHYAGAGFIKRLSRVRRDGQDRYQILSDNPAVPERIADIEDVHIIGKLVWVGRRM